MFLETKKYVEDGDLVLIWVSRGTIKPLVVQSGETLQTKFGPFRHDDIIGKRFGSQLPSLSGRGFVHVVAPTPELWALSLPHRTQIVYSPDASYIVQRLQILPGSKVIEAGTGSGALTHALARTVYGFNGKVWTYEYHLDRYQKALKEFTDHKLETVIHATHRNVCEDGFGLENLEPKATAVFLDLPAPWTAIPFLVNEGILDREEPVRICCFSPCIEQVVKTVEVLHRSGFRAIEMVENQARRWEGHQGMVRKVDEALDVLRDVRKRRSEGIERKKRKRAAIEIPEEERTEEQKAAVCGDVEVPGAYDPWGRTKHVKEGNPAFNWTPVSFAEVDWRSHTSFLTFAVLPPLRAHTANSESSAPVKEVEL